MKKLLLAATLAALSVAVPVESARGDDHVNLWPLVSSDSNGVDFLWPLGRYESPSDWRFFPIFKSGELFCVFPELWISDDSSVILPFYFKHDLSSGGVPLLMKWDVKSSSSYIFPLYGYDGGGRGDLSFWFGCGLGGMTMRDHEVKSHWLLPLYAKDKDGGFFSIPYSRFANGPDRSNLLLAGLGGFVQDGKGDVRSHWLFPLYNKDESGFRSLPFSCRFSSDGAIDSWMSALTLSGGWHDGTDWNEIYLLGMAGRTEEPSRNFSSSWLAPVYYGNSEGTVVTPVYGRSKGAQWGLPGWYKDNSLFLSPLWCHHTDEKGELDSWVMPFLLSGGFRSGRSRTTGFLLNAAGWTSDDNGYFGSWCLPFYYADNDGLLVTPVYGRTRTSQWCFPLWYQDESSLISPFWCGEWNADGSLGSWFVPPLLSGDRRRNDGSHATRILMGLGGADWGGPEGCRSSWFFPFYYENNDGVFVTPIAGRKGSVSWALPLYCFVGDTGDFISIPYVRLNGRKSSTYALPPLLSWYTAHKDGSDHLSLMLLYGHDRDDRGCLKKDYLFPLYGYNAETGDFRSLIYGTNRRQGFTWWLTPLVGTYSAEYEGGWVFPFFNRKKSLDYDLAVSYSEARTLTPEMMKKSFSAQSTGSVLLGSDHDHSISGSRDHHDRYCLREESKHGNRLLVNYERKRMIAFDPETGARLGEQVDSETMVLCGLFMRTHKEDAVKGTSHTRTRLLWKFWDREEDDGEVTLDAFPAITHETKKSGYTKTSFLWRFFRYEKDPDEGTKVDLLFIPVWR